MAEIRTVTTLRRKRDEIKAAIRAYEKKLEQAKIDLAHVNAAIRLFEVDGDPKEAPAYVDVHRLFGRFEKWQLCAVALAKHGDLSTQELAQHVIAAKGLDGRDKVLARTIAFQLVQSLRMQAMRGRVVMTGKSRGVCVWRLPHATASAAINPDASDDCADLFRLPIGLTAKKEP